MKRILPLLMALPLGIYACSDDSSDSGTQAPGTETPGTETPGTPGTPGGPGGPGAPTADELTMNPTEGVAPAASVAQPNQFTDGPVWSAALGVLFFSTPLSDYGVFRMKPDGSILKIRNNDVNTPPIGNTLNAAGELITVEAKRILRAPADGQNVDPTVIATSWSGGVPPPPNDAGQPQGDGTFDTLNDVVARKDGTLYVTDPGYFAQGFFQNRIYRVDPAGAVQVVEAFNDAPRPNGIALSPDEKALYVGFEKPIQGTPPFIRKYNVNDDGTLGEWIKFADLTPDSGPDGLAVDRVGNVYVAMNGGIQVHKPTGEVWGMITLADATQKPTGLTFGGADLKTLYVTTDKSNIFAVSAKIPGLSQ